jgi:hypothetical protein
MKVNKEILHIESGVKQRVKQYIILNTSRKHVNYKVVLLSSAITKVYQSVVDTSYD